jgi:hypothetical protein
MSNLRLILSITICALLLALSDAHSSCVYDCDPNDPDFNVGTALQGGQDPPTSHRQCRKAQDQYCDLGGAFSYEQFFHVSMDYALQYASKAARGEVVDRQQAWQMGVKAIFDCTTHDLATRIREEFAELQVTRALEQKLRLPSNISDDELVSSFFAIQRELGAKRSKLGAAYGGWFDDLVNTIVNIGQSVVQPLVSFCNACSWELCMEGVGDVIFGAAAASNNNNSSLPSFFVPLKTQVAQAEAALAELDVHNRVIVHRQRLVQALKRPSDD